MIFKLGLYEGKNGCEPSASEQKEISHILKNMHFDAGFFLL
jgi:hypothetical protein